MGNENYAIHSLEIYVKTDSKLKLTDSPRAHTNHRGAPGSLGKL